MRYIIIPILIFFSSCSVSHKIKSSSRSTVDSLSTVKIDSVVVKTVDSTRVKKDNTITTIDREDNYQKVTVVEFDTTGHIVELNNLLYHLPDVTDAADYFPPIKKITITENGVKKEKHIIVANTSDSSQFANREVTNLRKNVTTDLHKVEVIKNKDIKRTSYWGWLWIALIIVAVYLVGWYFGIWGWVILWIKRTRKKDTYPVKYKK